MNLSGAPHLFAVNSIGSGDFCELHIGVTEIRDVIACSFSGRGAARHHAPACGFITSVIQNDDQDRDVVARERPKSVALSKEKSAVALDGNDLTVGQSQLDSSCGAYAPAQSHAFGAADFQLGNRFLADPSATPGKLAHLAFVIDAQELRFYVDAMRNEVQPDGLLPATLDALVVETFGDLLPT